MLCSIVFVLFLAFQCSSVLLSTFAKTDSTVALHPHQWLAISFLNVGSMDPQCATLVCVTG